ncbi:MULTISPECIES: NAD(P)-dependent oxidoreductase [unclassified Methylophaga]|jgi:3-hydroxyisobutyrate dehydrogenase|uniref:NAD(P)-dependent oxidoreductase n=1 Tax=unclassified Methylophaga TaxID=2629249 RepID=UPI000C91ABC0|nr:MULTISPECIES: NAD(P)-dependent oxidoreductase [unclassified Methylophaga]MAK66603.1 hydroxyacid dehydrogenase [Methylophaga sp.]MAY17519.1 hydroxyacid dehydrogenase [Methylophaga sp.]HAO24584.1 hydroxyacid dehydrogenase [Methylophaga sp.]|tara:strand:- start:9514 stop:10377 length:864 start_codon:yes stop_codon:yes gene_type:complete
MKIGILGGGLMGSALAEHLLNQKCELSIYNRSIDKITTLSTQGANVFRTASETVQQSQIVILLLTDADAIATVLDSVEPSSFIDKLFIQMGTIAPQQSQHIEAQLNSVGARYLECPVLGSLPEARNGKLILMAAGPEQNYRQALPLLKMIGETPRYIGETGQGAAVKLALNQLIAGLTASFSLSLALIEEHQIDTEQFMQILRESALYAPTFDKKLERMCNRNFSDPNFPTKHLAKDTHLFLEVGEQLRLDTTALEGIARLLDKTMAMGLGNTDYSAIYAAISPDRK